MLRASLLSLSLIACGLAENGDGHAVDAALEIGNTADAEVEADALDAGDAFDGGDADASDDNEDAAYASPATVKLGMAGDFVILAMSGISTVPASVITGDVGVSPAFSAALTGFSLVADGSNMFSTSTQITGKVYAADDKAPTPANLTGAISDLQTAFTDAASRAADVTELGAGDISGMTITRGVYKWSSGLLISTDVTLSGSATDVWIFEIAQGLTMAATVKILLTGGALAKNIFWQFSGAVVLGTTAHIEGVILAQTSIALQTGASIKGRLLAQSAVTIDTSTIAP